MKGLLNKTKLHLSRYINRNQFLSIEVHSSVKERLQDEKTKLIKQVKNSNVVENEINEPYYRLLALGYISDYILEVPQYSSFRMASKDECQKASVKSIIKNNANHKETWRFHFLETCGYQLTLLIDLSNLNGRILHFEKNTEKINVSCSIKKAYKKYKDYEN